MLISSRHILKDTPRHNILPIFLSPIKLTQKNNDKSFVRKFGEREIFSEDKEKNGCLGLKEAVASSKLEVETGSLFPFSVLFSLLSLSHGIVIHLCGFKYYP